MAKKYRKERFSSKKMNKLFHIPRKTPPHPTNATFSDITQKEKDLIMIWNMMKRQKVCWRISNLKMMTPQKKFN